MVDKPELRLALAMRGGVSLAVWMGGACSEIDRLRRALDGDQDRDGRRGEPYRTALEANGYGSVAVDVVAGASAGGLNSMLTACSVVYGMRFDSRIRDLWLKLGDIGALRRRHGDRPPASLLDGDRSFYGALLPELRALVEDGGARPAQPPRMDVVLTCTLLHPVARTRFQDLGPAIVERRHRAWFRFRHLPGAGEDWSDFGHDPGEQEAALRRLAYAARSTSSFPGAFEPARVGAVPSSGEAESSTAAGTHYGCYSESRPSGDGPESDLVIDGGVLDNIPVAWAIRSIAGAPADRSVDRWLLYLQPLPFRRPAPGPDGVPDSVATARRARQLQGGTEALADDLDELEAVQRDAQRRRGFRQVLEYALGQVPTGQTEPPFLSSLFERALAAVPSYRLSAGEVEAGRIRRLWIDPLPVFSTDPLGFRDVVREPLAGRSAPERLLRSLAAAQEDLVLDAATSGVTAVPASGRARELESLLLRLRSPQALARTVATLLDAARDLGEPAYALKAELYVLRAQIEHLIASTDRALAAEPLRDPQLDDAEEVVRRAGRRVDGPPDEPGWPDHTAVWRRLVDHALQLAALVPADDERAFVGCLAKAAADQPDARQAMAAVLATVEVLTGAMRPDPLAETGLIRFHMLSAQNQSLGRRRDGRPPTADDLRSGTDGSVDAKLAGNQLMNFGAFLSARWRLNDWTWGRLDAARSLVEIVTQPRPDAEDPLPALRERLAMPTASLEEARDALVRQLQDGILREELPLLAVLGHGPPSPGLSAAAVEVERPLDLSRLQQAGEARVRDLVREDPARALVLARLGASAATLVAGSALAPLVRRLRSVAGAGARAVSESQRVR